MAAPNPPSVHGVMRISNSASQGEVWGGRFSFTTATAGNKTETITDSNFTSRIVRASNQIILTAANISAASLYNTLGTPSGVFAKMTNNASILLSYFSPGAGGVPSFYFMIFSGGTVT